MISPANINNQKGFPKKIELFWVQKCKRQLRRVTRGNAATAMHPVVLKLCGTMSHTIRSHRSSTKTESSTIGSNGGVLRGTLLSPCRPRASRSLPSWLKLQGRIWDNTIHIIVTDLSWTPLGVDLQEENCLKTHDISEVMELPKRAS